MAPRPGYDRSHDRGTGMSSNLQFTNEEADSPGAPCPNCGSAMAADAVICLQCGYDKRSGKAPGDDVGRKKPSPLVLAGLVLVIVAALAAVFLRSSDSTSAPPAQPSAPAPTPAPVSAPTSAPTAQEAIVPESPQPESGETAPSAASPTSDESGMEPPAEPAAPPIDWDAVAASHLQRLAEELDRRAPMFETGNAVELRLTNGLINRGVFQRLSDGGVVVQIATNESRTLAVESLDRNTRLRVEAEYRRKYLEYLVAQRVALEKSAAGTIRAP